MTLRILDVGAHDGYISAYLRQKLNGRLHIDAIEPTPSTAAIALRRLAGVGECKLGLAEDAPSLFPPRSFDAVVAFELLEHVRDVDVFLGALEAMVRPGGRVMLSTPEGTFGAGGNVNHLRVYEARDLTDLLRRRGRLADVQVGEDGVTVASYVPGERLGDVAIFTGPSWMRWSPMDIATRGLGGSETAAVRLADQLSKLGWVVTVWGDVDEGCVRDVLYRRWEAFDPIVPRHAVIASRMPHVFDRPVNAQHRLLWAHDVDFGDELTRKRAERVDRVLTLSRWHERHVRGRYPWLPAGKVARVRNGAQLSYYARVPAPDREQRVVYASSPDRGLDILLELWPRILERAPDATLVASYAPVYQRVAEQDPAVGAHAQRVRQLAAKQPSVRLLPGLAQRELADLLRSSMVLALPSFNTIHDTPFHETSCISAMEAQAAGCVVAASGWGAIPETAPGAMLTTADAGSGAWRDQLAGMIASGLTSPDVQHAAQRDGPAHAGTLGWDGVAAQFHSLIREPPPTEAASAARPATRSFAASS